jgi:hypothetical protein
MWNDPIVEEIRKARETHANQFNNDLHAIAADLKKQQKASRKEFVTLPPRKPAILPKAKVGKGK